MLQQGVWVLKNEEKVMNFSQLKSLLSRLPFVKRLRNRHIQHQRDIKRQMDALLLSDGTLPLSLVKTYNKLNREHSRLLGKMKRERR
jgi:hypothetical protein